MKLDSRAQVLATDGQMWTGGQGARASWLRGVFMAMNLDVAHGPVATLVYVPHFCGASRGW